MTTIVKAADAAQFLSLVPTMLGCIPARSLVLVPFHRGRSLGAMRLDLPGESIRPDAFASTCLGMVCRLDAVDAIAAVMFTDESCAEELPCGELAQALLQQAATNGLRMSDVLTVGVDGWGSHLDPQCPPGGRPLRLLDLPQPAGLTAPAGDQFSGAALPETDPEARAAVTGAMDSLRAALRLLSALPDGAPDPAPGTRVDPLALAAACTLDDLVTFFETALTWEPDLVGPYEAALLAWCLDRPAVRDIALVQWSGDESDGERAAQAQQRWEDGEEYPVDLAMTMWGEGPRPDPDRLRAALEISRHIAALAPEPMRPGPLSVCAWLSWALGRSTHAERYALQARAIAPEHGLSEIVLSFVAAGHLPDWAFRPR